MARFEALLTSSGSELLDRLASEAGAGGGIGGGGGARGTAGPRQALRLGTRLRVDYPTDLVVDALGQHELRTAAGAKFSRAMEMFFTRAGLEQASPQVVAEHTASRYAAGDTVADLCCGIGGDMLALAGHHRVIAVDVDPLHLRVARANADVLGVGGSVTTVLSDVRDVDLAGADAVFVDPARRAGQRRLRTGDSEPPLAWCLELAGRVAKVGIKAAPGLPREAVPAGWELEFIAVGRDLKEAVAWSPALATTGTRATLLPGGHTLTPAPAGYGAPAVPVRAPGEYLLDPNPAVTRAGLVAELARELGAWKIDERIAFLSADAPIRTPFGRPLRVIDSAPWNQKQLPARLRALDIGSVDIRRRGLAGDVDELRKRLKLSGTRRATLVMTRVDNRPWGLTCLTDE
ncbi:MULTISPECIES: THUMP-like domain-containing protein [unclassified Frankia]|uniref:THUMP-like domain-containing protein n=1 Tax=unclassified Frankia TaxID=2632575 RepID=UPI002023DB43